MIVKIVQIYNITKTDKMIADIAKKTESLSIDNATGYPVASSKLEYSAKFFRSYNIRAY